MRELFSKIFSKFSKSSNSSTPISSSKLSLSNVDRNFMNVHSDILNLIWILDGPNRNYVPSRSFKSYEFYNWSIRIGLFSINEPSLICMDLPVKLDVDPCRVTKLAYYPSYRDLDEEQKGVYWKFLSDPYTGDFDIGYVFIFYYGLERHLLQGNRQQAFNVILKLRDVYDNPSFQSYSASAIITTAFINRDFDMMETFYKSLRNDFNYSLPDNLYLCFKYCLGQPLTSCDIMRMSKTFGFTNQNYIRKYPDLFADELSHIMECTIGSKQLKIDNYVTYSEFNKLRKQDTLIFGNISFEERGFSLPIISDCFKLKMEVYKMLEKAHNSLKLKLSDMRKKGEFPDAKKCNNKKVVKILKFDVYMENKLLSHYMKSYKNVLDRHFALIQLQDFYYRYRDLGEEYLDKCINYCKEDLSHLDELQDEYMRDNMDVFTGRIPAFKRLAIIYEKQGKYDDAFSICVDAISYYEKINMEELVLEYRKRIDKINSKVTKVNS